MNLLNTWINPIISEHHFKSQVLIHQIFTRAINSSTLDTSSLTLLSRAGYLLVRRLLKIINMAKGVRRKEMEIRRQRWSTKSIILLYRRTMNLWCYLFPQSYSMILQHCFKVGASLEPFSFKSKWFESYDKNLVLKTFFSSIISYYLSQAKKQHKNKNIPVVNEKWMSK